MSAYPMVGADVAVGSGRTGTHVEELDGQTLTVKAHHGRPTWRPILHITQISVIIH